MCLKCRHRPYQRDSGLIEEIQGNSEPLLSNSSILVLTSSCYYRPHYATALHDAYTRRDAPKRGGLRVPDLHQLDSPHRVRLRGTGIA